MIRFSLKYLLCAALVGTSWIQPASSQQVPVQSVVLTQPREIADAAAVNRAISVMVRDEGICSQAAPSGARPCACNFTQDLKKLKDAYGAVVAKHQGWSAEGKVVSYVDPANGKSVVLNFPAVKRQLDVCSRH